MPVGKLSPMMSSSDMLSRCLTTPRSELPWAAMMIFLPACEEIFINAAWYFWWPPWSGGRWRCSSTEEFAWSSASKTRPLASLPLKARPCTFCANWSQSFHVFYYITAHPWQCWRSKDDPQSCPEGGHQKISSKFGPRYFFYFCFLFRSDWSCLRKLSAEYLSFVIIVLGTWASPLTICQIRYKNKTSGTLTQSSWDLRLSVLLRSFSFVQTRQSSVVALVQTPSLILTNYYTCRRWWLWCITSYRTKI